VSTVAIFGPVILRLADFDGVPGKFSSLKAKIKKLLASQKEMIKDNQNYR
jgi:hypothetical protein